MKKMIKYLKEIHYFNYLALSIIFILLGVTVWLSWNNFGPYWISIKDLAINFAKYLITLFYQIERPSPFSVIDISVLEKSMFSINAAVWSERIRAYFVMMINGHNLMRWGASLLNFLIRVMQIVIYAAAPIVLLWFVLKAKYFRLSLSRNLDKKSIPLQMWEKFYEKIVMPVINWTRDFALFFYYRRVYFASLIFILLFGTNVLKAAIDVLSWFFYFVVSPLAIASVFELLLVLLIDLLPFLVNVPLFVYLVVAYAIFRKIARRNAIRRLRHFEAMNRGFVKSKGSVLMWVGTVGTGKTKTMTDFLYCTEEIFRDGLFDIIKKSELRFPNFPWAKLERSLHVEIKNHRIINRIGAKDYVSQLETTFMQKPCSEFIFDYDYKKYGFDYFDGLFVETIWERMKIYAMAYFCYILNTPLVAANYGIRFRYSRMYEGHFVLYNYDYLTMDNRYLDEYSKYAKVLPMDDMRRTRFMIPMNPNRYTLDCCAIGINEIGKERKNAPELEDTERGAEEANQKNDGFNLTVKYARHISMIDHKSFYRIYMDDQRPTSLNADLRELSDSIFDMGKAMLGEQKVAIWFWWLEPIICEWIIDKRNDFHYRFRFNRSDQTLLIRLWGWLAKKATMYMETMINNYGYKSDKLSFTDGDISGDYQNHPYYFINKKMYSRTYSTDTAGEYFENEFRKAKRGFNELRTFTSERATVEDLEATEGYVWQELKDMSKAKLLGTKNKKKKGKK